MKSPILILSLLFTFVAVNAQTDGLPENPVPGKCYVKCVTPDVFKDITETIVVKPAYKTLEIIPAKYEEVTETVIVKEASKRFEFVPAVYETVAVNYVKKDGRTDLNIVPASFSDDTETREVYPKVARFEYSPEISLRSPAPTTTNANFADFAT